MKQNKKALIVVAQVVVVVVDTRRQSRGSVSTVVRERNLGVHPEEMTHLLPSLRYVTFTSSSFLQSLPI